MSLVSVHSASFLCHQRALFAQCCIGMTHTVGLFEFPISFSWDNYARWSSSSSVTQNNRPILSLDTGIDGIETTYNVNHTALLGMSLECFLGPLSCEGVSSRSLDVRTLHFPLAVRNVATITLSTALINASASVNISRLWRIYQ